MLDAQTAIDIATGVISLASALAGVLGAVWLFFRRRIREWWAPYRAGIEGAAQVPELKHAITEVKSSVNLLHLRMAARANYGESVECDFDTERRMINCNAVLTRRLGIGKGELLGFGYMGRIHTADQQGFREQWKLCAEEHRVFDWMGRMVASDGEEVYFHWIISPIPEPPAKPIQQWLGVAEVKDAA